MFDAIIVGAGPAGTSCALWLKQLGFQPVVIDRQHQCGGLQLANPYSNTWIATSADAQGKDVAEAMHSNMLRHKVDLRLGREVDSATLGDDRIGVTLANDEALAGRFLILAGGVVPKTGGFANRLSMFIGPGRAAASRNFVGTKVAILGGGDSAFENHPVALQRGAASVTIFARSLKARPEMLSRVPPDDVTLGAYEVDAEASTVNGEKFDHIMVFYGYEVDSKSLLGLELAKRPDGFVSTDDDCLTSHARVFAIGELAGRAHPCCTTAMADGVVAAKAIQRRLETSAAQQYAGLVRRAAKLSSKVFS
jgi:thioredoxin reductase